MTFRQTLLASLLAAGMWPHEWQNLRPAAKRADGVPGAGVALARGDAAVVGVAPGDAARGGVELAAVGAGRRHVDLAEVGGAEAGDVCAVAVAGFGVAALAGAAAPVDLGVGEDDGGGAGEGGEERVLHGLGEKKGVEKGVVCRTVLCFGACLYALSDIVGALYILMDCRIAFLFFLI